MERLKELEKKLTQAKEEKKIDILLELAEIYNKKRDFENELNYLKQTNKLAEKLGDEEQNVYSLTKIGDANRHLSNYEKALDVYLRIIKLPEVIKNKKKYSSLLNYIGISYWNLSSYDLALEYYFKSLQIRKEISDQEQISSSYNNIGLVYCSLRNFEKALEFHFKALKYREKLNVEEKIAKSLNNIGNVYNESKNYEQALIYHLKALKIWKNKKDQIGLSHSFNNVGDDYQKLHDYNKALTFYLESLQLKEEINDRTGIANTLKNIGKTHFRLNNLDDARLFLEKSLKLAIEIKANILIKESYSALSELFEAKKDFKKALQYHKKLTKMNNKIFNEDIRKKISEMETKFEIEKKEKQADILKSINLELKQEIAERKKAEKSLHQLKQAIEATQIGITISDTLGKIIYLNPAIAEMHGYEVDELLGKQTGIFANHENKKLINLKSVKKWKGLIRERVNTRKDGSIFPVWLMSKVVKDETGDPIAIVTTCEDITERKKTEEQLKQAKEEWEKTFNSLNDLISIQDMDFHYVAVNKAFARTYHRKPEDFVGKKCYEIIHGFDSPQRNCPYQNTLITQKISNEDFYDRFKDQYFNVSTSPIFDENGKMTRIVEIASNITQRKKNEKELQSHRELLTLINKILRHDLTNNLAVITSAIRMFQDTKDEDYLNEIFLNINKGVKLIRRMKDLELFTSNHKKLSIYEVRELIDQLTRLYTHIEFNVSGFCQVLADDALPSVFDNIISNAVIHGKTKRIDIIIEKDEKFCILTISDYGIGIPDNIKEKIFDESFKYGKSGKTGLGLYIVKKTIERYGGEVDVENNEHQGTVFVLKLLKV